MMEVLFEAVVEELTSSNHFWSFDKESLINFTDYGKKMSFFKQKTPVCVEIERYTSNLSEYEFVVLYGNLELVENQEERRRVIVKMAELGKQQLSPKFLVAHGFPQGSDWSDFSIDQPILIIKLDDVKEKTGLKSP